MIVELNKTFSADFYLNHRDYFDTRLLLLLESQKKQIDNLKFLAENRLLLLDNKRAEIRSLKLINKDLKAYNCNLKNKLISNDGDYKRIINEQEKRINNLDKTIKDELEKSYEDNNKLNDENRKLREELRKLRRQNNKDKKASKLNSSNSSLPPASDLRKPKVVSQRIKSDKPVGAQKGHKLNKSKLKKHADKIIYKYVNVAPSGAILVKDELNEYYVTQEIDAFFETKIIETRYFIGNKHPKCDHLSLRKYKINNVSYSESFKSIALYLNSKGTLPLDRLCTIINELSQNEINLSAGTIVNWLKEFNTKATSIVETLETDILKSKLIFVDESGWNIDGKRNWMHVMSTINTALFYCTAQRSGIEYGPISKLKEYTGYLVHDHFKPYYRHLTQAIHVECNAHIIRYLNAGIDLDGNIGCAKLKRLLQKMQREKKLLIKQNIGEMTKEKLKEYEREYLEIIETTLREYYENNPNTPKKYEPDYVPLMKRLKEYQEEHLRFIRDFNVPFDNNQAERMIRGIKTKKKVSGQSKNLMRANDYAIIHSINQTAKLRRMNNLKTIEKILNNQDPFDCFILN